MADQPIKLAQHTPTAPGVEAPAVAVEGEAQGELRPPEDPGQEDCALSAEEIQEAFRQAWEARNVPQMPRGEAAAGETVPVGVAATSIRSVVEPPGAPGSDAAATDA